MTTTSWPSDGSATQVATSSFRSLGTNCQVLVTDPHVLDQAHALALKHLNELDAAASRFRPDSEVSKLADKAAKGPATLLASFVLADYLRAALEMAELTDGIVDPSVGSAVVASGYDADIDQMRASSHSRGGAAVPVPGWRSITINDLAPIHRSMRAWVLCPCGSG